MSEEEKKAIEYVKAQRGKYYKTIINLIEKQKEIIDRAIEVLEAKPYTAYTLYR